MSQEQSQEHPKMEAKQYVVALIDVLGQRNDLDKLRSIPQDGEDSSAFLEGLKATVGNVDEVRRTIVTSCDRKPMPTQTKNHPSYALIGDSVKRELARAGNPAIKLQFFCDTVLMYSPIVGDDGLITVIDLYNTLATSAAVMLTSLWRGRAVRGGIELGTGIEWEEGEIYGPALQDAYDLESKCAGYPRIIVGRELMACLHHLCSYVPPESQFLENDEDAQRAVLCKSAAETCLSLIMQDDDGLPIVDWLGKSMRAIHGLDNWKDMINGAVEFVEQCHHRFISEGDYKLAGRYARLRHYCSSRRAQWLEDETKTRKDPGA